MGSLPLDHSAPTIGNDRTRTFRIAGRPASNATTAVSAPVTNALSVDVEDYYQVEAFKDIVSRADWAVYPSRVVQSTQLILRLLSDANVRGTFFTLGCVAKQFPELVREIVAAGHEVASHGSNHDRADRQSAEDFFADIADAKALLEDISGTRVRGYRAPTFSIGDANWWAYDMLAKAGYEYSSSIFPISHDLYGMPEAPRTPFFPTDGPLLEIPMSTVRFGNRNFPCSGGGFFRLLPYAVSKWSLTRVNHHDRQPGIFYCHPWEFDAGQPRMANAGVKSRFRHYTNIEAMPKRFARLLRDFSWDRMDRVFLGQADR